MKERNNKKKKGIVKKVFLIIAAILLVWLLTDIIVTEVYAGKIPHHYASAKEGRELMLSNTEYYENVTQIDPEECLADNFKYAMYYGIDGWNGQGYPNPEIIQDIIDVMKK